MCAVFVQVVVVVLWLTIIGMPLAFLINLMPGVWIYLTPTLAIYFFLRRALRRVPPLVALATAALPPIALGFLIPALANHETDKKVESLIRQDFGDPPVLPPRLSITHAIDRGLGSSGTCWDHCQRLLFSGTAKSIVEVPLDSLPMLASLPTPAHRFSLGKSGPDCNTARLRPTYASAAEIGREVPPSPPLLSAKLEDFAEKGLCLHDDTVRDARSDILLVERWNYDPSFSGFRFEGVGFRLSLHPIAPFGRREVFRQTASGMERLMRRTHVRYAHLAKPLWLWPGLSLDTSTPTHWAWVDYRKAGSPVTTFDPTRWNAFLANDLSIRGLE